MKKILSVCLAFVLVFSLAGCSSRTKEEKAVTGLWDAKYVQAGEDFVRLPSAYCALEIKDDKTATMSVVHTEGTETGDMVWAHTGETDNGMYAYEMVNANGGTLLLVYSPEDEMLILISAEDTGIVFEKVK